MGWEYLLLTPGKQGLDPFWESEDNCSGEVLAGAVPRPMALSAPADLGTAEQVLPPQGSVEG